VLDNGFVYWDDDRNFIDNPHYRACRRPILSGCSAPAHGHYQPLTWLSHAIVYTIWGMEPYGYHLGNVLLHAVNAVLVYVLIATCSSSWVTAPAHTERRSPPHRRTVFRRAPLRVEAVAWATERREVLCATFLLVSVLAYVRMAVCKGHSRAAWRRWYASRSGRSRLRCCRRAGDDPPATS